MFKIQVAVAMLDKFLHRSHQDMFPAPLAEASGLVKLTSFLQAGVTQYMQCTFWLSCKICWVIIRDLY